jgi:hypothetical protein
MTPTPTIRQRRDTLRAVRWIVIVPVLTIILPVSLAVTIPLALLWLLTSDGHQRRRRAARTRRDELAMRQQAARTSAAWWAAQQLRDDFPAAWR